MKFLWYDSETFSETPIRSGTYRYARDAEIMIATYAVDDGPVCTIDFTDPAARLAGDDEELIELLLDPDVIVVAHNSMFDRAVLAASGRPCPPIERWRDTMVQALAHALPDALGTLCDVLGVPMDKAKHKTGKDLIKLFCQPRPKNSKLRRATRETHPVEWQWFLDYAGADIEAMREVYRRLPQWNYGDRTDYGRLEIARWHLDQRINDRGFQVDLDLAEKAIALIDEEQERLADQTYTATGGDVARATQRDALLEHLLSEYGVVLPDLRASTLERRIDDPDLPPALRELLSLRLMTSTTSTSKYKALTTAQTGGRLRGTLQYNGASRTGRWAGRKFQPQNLPSRGLLPLPKIREGIEAIKGGYVRLIGEETFGNVMLLTASTIRGCITAPEGKRLCIADLSNIEGRILAWEAGEEWKLQAFRDYDTCKGLDGEWHTGTAVAHAVLTGQPIALELDAKGEPIRKGHDLYVMAYAKSFGVDPSSVTKKQRAVGKVQELALGYEGGVGAFVTFAASYGIDLEQMARDVWDQLPADLVSEAQDFYDWLVVKKGASDFGLSREAYVTCDVFKRAWRYGHAKVVELWAGLMDIAVSAVENPGGVFEFEGFRAKRTGAWLRLLTPSGRSLCYPSPQVEYRGNKPVLSYMGVNQYSRKWSRLSTHGGKLAENATQLLACEVLKANMPRIESAGYELVLSVHDELIAEAPDTDAFTGDALAGLMSTVPGWAEGLPLAAAGFHDYRYRKDD